MSKRRTRTEEERKSSEDLVIRTIEDSFKNLAQDVKEAVKSQRVEVKKEHLKFTVELEDATWISSLLYEECDRGLIKEVRINVTPAPHSIEIDIIITIVSRVTSELIIGGLDRLIKKIEERLHKEYGKKKVQIKFNILDIRKPLTTNLSIQSTIYLDKIGV